MFGIRYLKVQPTTYLLQYRGGQIVLEGAVRCHGILDRCWISF